MYACHRCEGPTQCFWCCLVHAASQYSARLFNPLLPRAQYCLVLLACFRSYSPVTRRLMNRLVTHRQPRVKVMNQAMSTMHTWGATGGSSRIQKQQQASAAAAGLSSACGSRRGRIAMAGAEGQQDNYALGRKLRREVVCRKEAGAGTSKRCTMCLAMTMTDIKRRAECC